MWPGCGLRFHLRLNPLSCLFDFNSFSTFQFQHPYRLQALGALLHLPTCGHSAQRSISISLWTSLTRCSNALGGRLKFGSNSFFRARSNHSLMFFTSRFLFVVACRIFLSRSLVARTRRMRIPTNSICRSSSPAFPPIASRRIALLPPSSRLQHIGA